MNDNDTLADDLRKDSVALMALLEAEKRKNKKLEAALRRIAAYSQGLTPIPGDPIEIARTALGSEMETKGNENG